jgi:NAD(P)-dependent dehydrogenase (short-subunit alcohol dehydrogenase family)
MDVCDDASVERAVATADSQGGIDVLVNNAGFALCATMGDVTLEDLKSQFETNFFGVVRVTQRVLPLMRQRRRGRIVNMSSIAGKYSFPLFGPYSASKHALEGMTDALRIEARLHGIHVVLIEPGYIPTNMGSVSEGLAAQYREAARSGPDAPLYKAFRDNWKKTTRAPKYTPEDCARIVHRAIEAPRPKARYTVTRRAALISLAKRVLTDAYFDRRALRAFAIEK